MFGLEGRVAAEPDPGARDRERPAEGQVAAPDRAGVPDQWVEFLSHVREVHHALRR
jgi:hypothetical protein